MQKNMYHWNIHQNNSCGDKVVVLNVDNTNKVSAAENFYSKSSNGERIIILKPKMQKNVCH